jgi:hypothetical protein
MKLLLLFSKNNECIFDFEFLCLIYITFHKPQIIFGSIYPIHKSDIDKYCNEDNDRKMFISIICLSPFFSTEIRAYRECVVGKFMGIFQ